MILYLLESQGMSSESKVASDRRLEDLVDSRVLRNKRLQTPSGPEGSSGSNPLCVPQGSLAINKIYMWSES